MRLLNSIIVTLFLNGCGWACFSTGPYCFEATDATYNMYEATHAPLPWAAQAQTECWVYIPCQPVAIRPGSCSSWAVSFPPNTIPCTVIDPNLIRCAGPLY